jgi:cytochrome c oxidase cbb3-type subunit 1
LQMTASTTSTAPSAAVCPAPATTAEIDASCRGPVLLLFWHSILWLVIGSILTWLVAIKMHKGDFLANCPWFTYGRLNPAARDLFLYGFASQAGMGVALWLLARLGRTPLIGKAPALIGGMFWNLGVLLGTFGILAGDSTGHEGFEYPGYAAPILFFAFLAIASAGMFTFINRREHETYISQWLIFVAFLIFPWIDVTANALLICHPARGMMQAVLAYWFANNFLLLWLTPLALAAVFYLIPKIVNRPLYSHYLAAVGFWLLVLFSGWGGVPPGARLPAWMSSVSAAASFLVLVPVFAALLNWRMTIGCDCTQMKSSLPGRFLMVGTIAYVLSSLLAAGNSLPFISQTTEFTLFTVGLSQLSVYGFIGMTLFGGIYYIVPQLTGIDWKPSLAKGHFTFSVIGIALIVIGFMIGGIRQSNSQSAAVNFLFSVKAAVPFIGLATLGSLCLILAHLSFLSNFVGVMRRACAACCGCGKEAK